MRLMKRNQISMNVRVTLLKPPFAAMDLSFQHRCHEFWSEDLNDGQIYCGVKAVNPFK